MRTVLVLFGLVLATPAFGQCRDVGDKLTTGQVVVPRGKLLQFRFTVDREMRGARVVGNFRASGGTGNDIQVVIGDEDALENWRNGHPAQVIYATPKLTVGRFDVRINAPGTYYVGLNNSFAVFSNKYVFADIELRYTRCG